MIAGVQLGLCSAPVPAAPFSFKDRGLGDRHASRVPKHADQLEADEAAVAGCKVCSAPDRHAPQVPKQADQPGADEADVADVLTRLRLEREHRSAQSEQAAEAGRLAAELMPTRTRGAHATIAAHEDDEHAAGERHACVTHSCAEIH